MPSIQQIVDELLENERLEFNTQTFSLYMGIQNPDTTAITVVNEEILLASDEISVGVEVELENLATNWRGASACSNWDVVNDGSLRGVAREIRSRGPVRGSRLKEDITQLFQSFQSNDLVPHANMRTSMHVHVNMLDMTRVDIVAFLVTASLADSILFQHTGENRAFTGYSAPTDTLLAKLAGAAAARYNTHATNEGFLGFSTDSLGSRYQSVNLKALTKHGTVEFRHFETPNTKQEMISIINACISVKLLSKELSNYLVLMNDFINPELMYYKAKELLEIVFPEHVTTMNKEDFCELFELGSILIDETIEEEGVLEPIVHTYEEVTGTISERGNQVNQYTRPDLQQTIPGVVMNNIATLLDLPDSTSLTTAPVRMPLPASLLSGGSEIFRGYSVTPQSILFPETSESNLRLAINPDLVSLNVGSVIRLGPNSQLYAVLRTKHLFDVRRDTWALVNVSPRQAQEYVYTDTFVYHTDPFVYHTGDIS